MTWGFGRVGQFGGYPVIVHHGLVGDAALGPTWAELGRAHGIEWIVIERPGYGATPPTEMDRLSDWPAMIAPVLNELGLTERFAAVGISAGAPYAYACAAGMPDRVSHLAILSGVPFLHFTGVLDAYPPDGRAAYARYRTASDADLRDEFQVFCRNAVARVIESGDVDSDRMRASLDAVLRHDAAGPAREARLQAVDWGFGPADIVCPTDIWHFKGDEMVPFKAAQHSATHLPKAATHFAMGAGHIATEGMLEEMARVLAQSIR